MDQLRNIFPLLLLPPDEDDDVIDFLVDYKIERRIIVQYVKTNINCQIEQYVRK